MWFMIDDWPLWAIVCMYLLSWQPVVGVSSVGDGDKAAEGEKPDESMAEGVNDSLAAGDITVDSVKVHIR